MLVAACVVSAGCTKNEQPQAQQPLPRPVIKPVTPVQKQASTAQVAATSSQQLDLANKKDPFKPFIAERAPKEQTRQSAPSRSEETLPIQSYDVNKFRVAGIIVGLKENTALIIDPAGRGYVVREGMLIGAGNGKIARITSTALEVIEQYRDDNGHLRKRSIILSLAKKK